jgi:Leucine-rich repeat (LRR) protein
VPVWAKFSAENLTKTATSLKFSGTVLSELPSRFLFSRNASLTFLSLDAAAISRIAADAFYFMGQLESLSLRHNRLTEIPAGVFTSLPMLLSLDLSHNRLLQPPPFGKHPMLNTLSLDSNPFRELKPAHFSGIAANLILLSLKAAFFDIPVFPPDLFDSFTNLSTLDISDNLFGAKFPDSGLLALKLTLAALLLTVRFIVFSNFLVVFFVTLCVVVYPQNNSLTQLPTSLYAAIGNNLFSMCVRSTVILVFVHADG